MKNRIAIGILVVAPLVFFYVATIVKTNRVYFVDAQVNQTPMPTPCDSYGIGAPVDSRYAPPYNLVSGYKGINIKIPTVCVTGQPIAFTFGNDPTSNMVSTSTFSKEPAPVVVAAYHNLIVAKKVYIYSPGSTAWRPLTNITSPDNNFFNSTINADWDYGHIKVNAGDLVEGNHYILGYSCLRKDGAWKCGCKNAQCTEQGWQIQRLTVKKAPTVCADPPDPLCGCGSYRYPPNCIPNDPVHPCHCSARLDCVCE